MTVSSIMPDGGSRSLRAHAGRVHPPRKDRGWWIRGRVPWRADGHLVYSRDEGDKEPSTVTELRRVIETRIPRIRIEDLLVEVDRWCGFSRELAPLGGYRPRLENAYPALLAALVARYEPRPGDDGAEHQGITVLP